MYLADYLPKLPTSLAELIGRAGGRGFVPLCLYENSAVTSRILSYLRVGVPRQSKQQFQEKTIMFNDRHTQTKQREANELRAFTGRGHEAWAKGLYDTTLTGVGGPGTPASTRSCFLCWAAESSTSLDLTVAGSCARPIRPAARSQERERSILFSEEHSHSTSCLLALSSFARTRRRLSLSCKCQPMSAHMPLGIRPKEVPTRCSCSRGNFWILCICGSRPAAARMSI